MPGEGCETKPWSKRGGASWSLLRRVRSDAGGKRYGSSAGTANAVLESRALGTMSIMEYV